MDAIRKKRYEDLKSAGKIVIALKTLKLLFRDRDSTLKEGQM